MLMLTCANSCVVPKAKVFAKTSKGVTRMHKGNAVRIQTKIILKTMLHRYNIDRKKRKKTMQCFKVRLGSANKRRTIPIPRDCPTNVAGNIHVKMFRHSKRLTNPCCETSQKKNTTLPANPCPTSTCKATKCKEKQQ